MFYHTIDCLQNQNPLIMQAVQIHLIPSFANMELSLSIKTLIFIFTVLNCETLDPCHRGAELESPKKPWIHKGTWETFWQAVKTCNFYGFDKHVLLSGELNAYFLSRHGRESILQACLEVSTFKNQHGVTYLLMSSHEMIKCQHGLKVLSRQYAKHGEGLPSSWFAWRTSSFPCLLQMEGELRSPPY